MAAILEPIPTTGLGTPETLPWATNGTTLEPIAAQEDVGWQPYGVGPPPDYRLENYFRDKVNEWLLRLQQAGFWREYASALATIGGFADPPVVGWTYTFTVDGNAVIYTVTTEATKAEMATNMAATINADPVVSLIVEASAAGPFVSLRALVPGGGGIFTIVLGGVHGGTFVLTGPAVPITRAEAADAPLDFVVGSPELDAGGAAPYQARIIWRKTKAAFRAGRDTIGAWDDANCGTDSTAWGLDCQADGDQATAGGSACVASGQYAVALGAGSVASGLQGVAIGGTATASGQNSVSLGPSLASGDDTVAAGTGAIATNNNDVAIGNSAVAIGGGAVAVGDSAAADAAGGVAVGLQAHAQQAGDVALGDATANGGTGGAFAACQGSAQDIGAVAVGNVTANGIGSLALGHAPGVTAYVSASGDGAEAHSVPSANDACNAVTAGGTHSRAHGDGVEASGAYARATGLGAVAANRGEIAHASNAEPVMVGFLVERERHQIGTLVAQARTTDATETTLCPDVFDGTGTTWTPKDDRAYRVKMTVVVKDEASTDCKAWGAEFLLCKDAGAFTSNGYTLGANMPGVGVLGAGFAASVAQIEDSGGGQINVRGTGAVGVDARWTCRIEYDQVGIDH